MEVKIIPSNVLPLIKFDLGPVSRVEPFALTVSEARNLYTQLTRVLEAEYNASAPTCQHTDPPRLSYGGHRADAERRLKAGQHQWYCSTCGRWIWAEFWLVDPATVEAICDTDPQLKKEPA